MKTVKKPRRTLMKPHRWTEAEWREIETRAEIMGVTPSDYIRWASLRKCSVCGSRVNITVDPPVICVSCRK